MTTARSRERTDIRPKRQQVLEYFQHGDLVPVYRTLLGDLETHISEY